MEPTMLSSHKKTRSLLNDRKWPGLFLLMPLLATLAGCTGEAKVEQDIVRPVKVGVVGEAARGRTVAYSGVVRPRIESAIGFRVAGKIVQRLVNVGDRVEVDQVIARLDDSDLQLAENSAKAAVASARSRRDVARDNFERGKTFAAAGDHFPAGLRHQAQRVGRGRLGARF